MPGAYDEDYDDFMDMMQDQYDPPAIQQPAIQQQLIQQQQAQHQSPENLTPTESES